MESNENETNKELESKKMEESGGDQENDEIIKEDEA